MHFTSSTMKCLVRRAKVTSLKLNRSLLLGCCRTHNLSPSCTHLTYTPSPSSQRRQRQRRRQRRRQRLQLQLQQRPVWIETMATTGPSQGGYRRPSLFIGKKKKRSPPPTNPHWPGDSQASLTRQLDVHTSKGCPLVRTVWGYLQLLTWTCVSCRAEWYFHSIDSNPIKWSSSLLLDTLALAPLWSIFL